MEREGRLMPLMTDAEHRAMDLTAQLWDLMVTEVIEDGPAADQDRREFAAQIHAVQHTIMAQVAARAYPDKYRTLGGDTLKKKVSRSA